MQLKFNSIKENTPGAKWYQLIQRFWPEYRKWFLKEGEDARPPQNKCVKKLQEHMPELLPIYDHLRELNHNDEIFSRFLSLYRPPAYISGCSQAVWNKQSPFLIRNYDYSPHLFDATVVYTAWKRRVIAMSDCLWGVLDGMNDAGLAVSLAFGGNKTVGKGFGIPLILRYILEMCGSTSEAVEVLRRVPAHMAYNVTVVDQTGEFITAFLSPHKETSIRRSPVATNYQRKIRWHVHARRTETLVRQKFLETQLGNETVTDVQFADHFLHPPLYSNHYDRGFGTLYTALYRPHGLTVEYRWPTFTWHQAFDLFREEEIQIPLKKAQLP